MAEQIEKDTARGADNFISHLLRRCSISRRFVPPSSSHSSSSPPFWALFRLFPLLDIFHISVFPSRV